MKMSQFRCKIICHTKNQKISYWMKSSISRGRNWDAKLNFIKIKLLLWERTYWKDEETSYKKEKNTAKHIPDKGLVSGICIKDAQNSLFIIQLDNRKIDGETFFMKEGRYTDGRKVHKEIFDVPSHKGNANLYCNEILLFSYQND
jgi:hypothetical protein